MISLQASLKAHPLAMLRGIAELRGVPLATNSREDAAAQLAARLAEPAATQTAMADTSPGARAAWVALRSAGGRIKLPAFTRSFGQIRPIGPGRLEREAIWLQPESPAEELWYRGLIFRAFADFGDGLVEYVYIPDDLLPPNSSELALSPDMRDVGMNVQHAAAPYDDTRNGRDLPIATTAQPKPRQAFNSLAVDLCSLLASFRTGPVRLQANGTLHPQEVARLQEGFVLQDAVRLEMLVTLAHELNWLVPAETGGPRPADSAGLRRERNRLGVDSQALAGWLRSSHAEQTRALFLAWRDSTDRPPDGKGWNDLRHAPGLLLEGTWWSDPLVARRAILAILRKLGPDAWYALPEFVSWIKATVPDFQRPEGDYHSWYLRDASTNRYLSGFESWDEVEGRLIHFLLTGPLFWLGAVMLAPSSDKQVEAFRLTPAAIAWLNDATCVELPHPERLVVVDADFTVTAPLWTPLIDRFRLLRFTDPVPDQYELGQPTRHRITRGSLARARAAGLTAGGIVQFLRRASGGRVPERVAASLTQWGQHSGAVRITKGAILRVKDADTLAKLRSDPAVAPLLGDLVSAQAVLVGEANLSGLLEILDQLGYAVKVE